MLIRRVFIVQSMLLYLLYFNHIVYYITIIIYIVFNYIYYIYNIRYIVYNYIVLCSLYNLYSLYYFHHVILVPRFPSGECAFAWKLNFLDNL